MCLLAVVAVSGAAQYIKQQVQVLQLRYEQLLQASTALDEVLQHIERMRYQDQQLRVRRELISQFQPRRSQALRLLNELPTWLPSGVRLDSLQLTGNALEIKGQVQNYEELALLAQRLEQQSWLSQPRLQAQVLPDTMLNAKTSEARQFSLQLSILVEPLASLPLTAQRSATQPAAPALATVHPPSLTRDITEPLNTQEAP